jgi:RNA polymerase sigma-70 factor (ECF subfamily)
MGRSERAPLRANDAEVHTERQRADDEDAALAVQSQRGQRNAFDALVKRYHARLYTHLYRMVRNREEAEDLTQETFLRAYRHLAHYDSARPFRNWIYTIATNLGLNALRTRQRRERIANTDSSRLINAPDAGESPAAPSERAERMADAIKELPPQSAVLIHLHYHEGMRIREAAEVVGMTENAAKVALCRARKILRTLLTQGDES